MVPMLDKYSTLTIGLTLITIGAMGLYETFGESPSQIEATQQTPPAMQTAGGGEVLLCKMTSTIQVCGETQERGYHEHTIHVRALRRYSLGRIK